MSQKDSVERNFGITLLLTSMCDTGCSHCMDSSTIHNPTHFPKEMAEEIMREVRQKGWNFLAFLTGGGEPLMHPDFLGVVDVFGEYEKTVSVGMVTSGFLEGDVSREFNLREFLQRPYVPESHVEQSFHLYHPSFSDRFVNMVKLLQEIRERSLMNVRMCLSFENCEESWNKLERTIQSAADEIGGDYYALPGGFTENEQPNFSIVERNLGRGNWHFDWIAEKESLLISRCYVIRNNRDGGILLNIRPIPFDNIGRGKKIQESAWSQFVCGIFLDHKDFFSTRLSVDFHGYVYPEYCCAGGHMRLGRVGQDSMEEMLLKGYRIFQRLPSIILADKRMFKWGTYEVCKLCQQIVAERGIELA
ncbi:MAG: hypothetical protein ACD_11C00022G0003 [uncultured bacterium]|nr:MAG: hypothetical protein ACD_11C00022G0003 [uncultured bacterium]HBR72023.1 hypothetical protein [Candidatus Moranbacteria bacterium]